jgi:uncharacterized protein YndB with AHSA1/START domain
MTELLIRKSIAIDTPAEILWKVLTDNEFIPKYMFSCFAESDWKPGSPLLWKGTGDHKLYVKGQVVSFEPHHRLVYTVFDPNSTLADRPSNYLTMTYELKDLGKEGTLLEITQGDFAQVEDGERRYQHTIACGDSMLEQIKELAEAQSPEPKAQLLTNC